LLDSNLQTLLCLAHVKNSISPKSATSLCIQLLAIEIIVRETNPNRITFSGLDPELEVSLRAFCKALRIDTSTVSLPKQVSQLIIERARETFFIFREFIKVVAYVSLLVQQATFLAFQNKRDKKTRHDFILIDIFTYYSLDQNGRRGFFSQYWGDLPDFLRKQGMAIGWLHNFYRSNQTPSISKATEVVQKLNHPCQAHELLESELNYRIILNVVSEYFAITKNLILTKNIFYDNNTVTKMPLWRAHRKMFLESCLGKQSVENILKNKLFDSFFDRKDKYKVGFFISEFQPWEFALMSSWKKHGHGKLISVPHTSIRFWDFRYFVGDLFGLNGQDRPVASLDGICVNGPVAKRLFLEMGVPKSLLIPTEALRFDHLRRSAKIKHSSTPFILKNILFCGDFRCDVTKQIINTAIQLRKSVSRGISFTFKPHPSDKDPRRNIRFFDKLTDVPIDEAIDESTIVVCSALSTVALDTALRGIYTFQIAELSMLDHNLLRGITDQRPAVTADQLANLINAPPLQYKMNANQYFYLNKNLRMWKKVIDELYAHSR
jgi:surface carbohydrate biosynthesis protein (TIGR04326 family)